MNANENALLALQLVLQEIYRPFVERQRTANVENSRTPMLEKQGADELLLAIDTMANFDTGRLDDAGYRAALRESARLFKPQNFTGLDVPAFQRSNATLTQFHDAIAIDPRVSQGLAELAIRLQTAEEQDIVGGKSFLQRFGQPESPAPVINRRG